MKLLVFAHTPPPHHGQSYMVKLMLDRFGGDRRKQSKGEKAPVGEIECYHVNSRFSDDLADIGALRIGKVLLMLRYCVEAIWCRFRYGTHAFYYVPAPGKRAALYRDWIVMLLCRPFFRHFVHHWHAAGLGDWLAENGTPVERWITHRLLGKPALGIAVAIASMRDSLWFRSRKAEVVPYGIPDPCPNYVQQTHDRRSYRLKARCKLLNGHQLLEEERAMSGGDPEVFRVLFLSNCLREKGLFDTIDGVVLANQQLNSAGAPVRVHLTVAGGFLTEEEETEFKHRLENPQVESCVSYSGFCCGNEKALLLHECDCLCFPTYYGAESFGLVVIEAMAAGMSIVTTRWRALPEILPPNYPGLVPIRAPKEIAATFQRMFRYDSRWLRTIFEERFTESRYLEELSTALRTLPAGE
jgi:glycosyltransferase involved in cell wall biosynthesis